MSLRFNIICAFLFWFSLCVNAQNNVPPVITADGEQVYCPLTAINVVTDFDITDPDDTGIEAVYIQVSTGYEVGFDTLELTGNHPNIEAIWSPGEGKLTLRGSVTPEAAYVDLIAAVKDVVFKSTNNNPSEKFFSFTIGDANYLPKTGHYYEYVSAEGISWSDAKAEAETRTYFGLQGYLATVLFPEEAQLIGEQAAGTGWIGGSDAETEGVWKWVTGPEAGTVFWNGGPNGSTPNYANWNTGEPNNMGDEDYAHVTAPGVGIPGSWNDLKIEGDPPGDYHPKGYVVEYGGFPNDPVLNISDNTHISVTKIVNTQPASRCGSGSVNLEASASTSTAEVLWFDASTGGNVLGNGNTFSTPVINSTTTYYALASENGCMEGERTPVVATIYEVPVVQQNIVFKNCDEDDVPNDGTTDFNLEEANNIITYSNSTGLTLTYHKTYADADSGTGAINPIYNNSEGNTVYARVENTNGCYDIATVDLQVSTTSFPSGYIQELETCDDDNTIDGYHTFNLTQASNDFIAQFPPGQNLSVHYFRNFQDAQLEQNEILNTTDYVNEQAFSQILYVRVESDDNGDCYGLGPHLQLTVHPRPEFEVGQTKTYCSDGNPVTLYTFNSTGDFSYEWTNENGQIVGNSPDITIVSGGTYTVVATSDFYCESFPVSYLVNQSAVASISKDDISIVELSDNNSITINNENNNLGIGNYEFALDKINGPYQDEPFFDHVGAGVHKIFVRDKNACGIATLEVFILGFPKFFTPNNDGNNDTWQVRGLGPDFTDASIISVFDRYGKLIKQLSAKNGYWDGTFNGRLLISSDYWFVAELIESATGIKRMYRGHFSLIR